MRIGKGRHPKPFRSEGLDPPVSQKLHQRRRVSLAYLRGSLRPRLDRRGILARCLAKLRRVVVRQGTPYSQAKARSRAGWDAALQATQAERTRTQGRVD